MVVKFIPTLNMRGCVNHSHDSSSVMTLLRLKYVMATIQYFERTEFVSVVQTKGYYVAVKGPTININSEMNRCMNRCMNSW